LPARRDPPSPCLSDFVTQVPECQGKLFDHQSLDISRTTVATRYTRAAILAQGYPERKIQNPLYRSTLADLGTQPPSRFDLPAKYEPLSTKFSGVRDAIDTRHKVLQ